MKIICSNPLEQFKSKKKQIYNSVKRVLNSSNYILGENVKNFENEFSNYIGLRYSVGVANGTDALELALKSLNIGKGDEVITVSHTALATVSAIYASGATPVLVDVSKEYFTIDTNLIKKNITKKTKAIIAVHIYGQSVNLDEILKICKSKKIKLIEDVSQAHGGNWRNNKLGYFGDLSTFSFYPTKNLGAIGDGGLISTKDKKLYLKLKSLREYGWNYNRIASITGRNSRLDELQAAILRVKLKFLNKDIKKRQLIAKTYIENINSQNVELPKICNIKDHAFHLFVIKVKKRNLLFNYLKKNNIICGIHYPLPIHLQPGYKKIVKIRKKLKNTELLSKIIISLPIYPELSIKSVVKISKLINSFYRI